MPYLLAARPDGAKQGFKIPKKTPSNLYRSIASGFPQWVALALRGAGWAKPPRNEKQRVFGPRMNGFREIWGGEGGVHQG